MLDAKVVDDLYQQAHRRCRELLTRFLGIPPNAKTQALYHSVRERAAYAAPG
jgi:uncharacterized RmlC-like cupin family protein